MTSSYGFTRFFWRRLIRAVESRSFLRLRGITYTLTPLSSKLRVRARKNASYPYLSSLRRLSLNFSGDINLILSFVLIREILWGIGICSGILNYLEINWGLKGSGFPSTL